VGTQRVVVGVDGYQASTDGVSVSFAPRAHRAERSVTFDTMSGRWVSWPISALRRLRRRRRVHRRQRSLPTPLLGVLMGTLPFVVGGVVAIALAAYLT
jgi:hypothetical protein